jgi:diguanylate cyclase (GGDEF)-like protein
MDRTFIKSLPLLALVMSVTFWLVDTSIDVYLLGEEKSFRHALFMPEPVELWMRSLVTVMMVLFGFYTKRLLEVQKDISSELTIYKNNLELIVKERTEKLEEANIFLQKEIAERKKIENKLEQLATTDHLTLLYNRRKFDELLEYEIEKDKRYQLGLSLIYCDIDNFKNINDMHGHNVGDEILITFAMLLKESLRESDIVARWGGEEFIVLIPSKTADIAVKIAEKMRKSIEENVFLNIGTVTASFGVTHYINNDTKKTIFKRVDEALYEAKENGRNCVKVLL